MKIKMPFGTDQVEQHFLIMIYLMMTFFFVNVGLEVLAGKGIVTTGTASSTSHDAFIAFFGIAVGMFRGMQPQGSLLAPPVEGQKTTVTTDVHSEKTSPDPAAEEEKKP